jgi:hypothetical protein
MMNASHRRRVKRLVNEALAELCIRYQDSIPLPTIQMILSTYGLHLEPGIYTGRDGHSLEPVGLDLWLSLGWHKLEVTGMWEIVAYVS